ncbi:putative endonuclease/exonuclease/phosphatase [Rosa chinensis]|uniref:Putative endonuclease/exonuclease/phosphatase n=1 Tax=Rosa chinensis TaxID=74649 RepID=A0A2P6Q921_ROSCH|nr:putative endonuclease/exonuclease/phosphatase [Rosa chinensis]
MNCISWNCQGLGRSLTVQTLREIIRSHDNNFIFLSETHKSDYYVDRVRRQLGYSKGYNVAPVNTAGGLSLWWRPGFLVEVTDFSKYFIDTRIRAQGSNEVIRVTWMYGPPYGDEKAAFWDYWSNLQIINAIPWLVIGDLNELVEQYEREGGSHWNSSRRSYLRTFISSHSLLDPGFKGQRFTWARVEDGVTRLQERLDRSLVSESWLLKWPNSCLTHLARVGFDHNPLFFSSDPLVTKRKSSFKFEAYWAEESESFQIVK